METTKQAVWQTAKQGTPEGFLMMLKEYTLDPCFEAYGDFGHLVNSESYHPDHRAEWKIKEDAGVWEYMGNFFDVSWSINMEISDPEMIKKISEAITIHKQTPKYKRARAERFNCNRFKILYYLNKEELDRIKPSFDRWWHYSETSIYLPLDYTQKEYDKAYAEVSLILAKGNSKLKHQGEIELNPEEVHFTGHEWSDIVKDFHNTSDPLSLTRWSQVMRVIDKPENENNEWKRYTFDSSGRTIMYKWDTYGNSYYNVTDPFRD